MSSVIGKMDLWNILFESLAVVKLRKDTTYMHCKKNKDLCLFLISFKEMINFVEYIIWMLRRDGISIAGVNLSYRKKTP